jgi:hypothetical protein
MYFVAHDVMARTVSDDWDGDDNFELWSDDEDLKEVRWP